MLFLGSLAFLVLKGKQLYKSYKQDEELDTPFLLGLVSLLFQNGSFLFEILHLLAYRENGEGVLAFQVLSQVASVCSQLTITVFLVLVSWGWTLTYRRLKKCEFYVPLIITIAIVHIVMVGLDNVDTHTIDRYHSYDGVSGTIMLVLRIAIFAYYIFGIHNT